jgi:3-hydroxyacyl-CoA dehydrogenase
VNRVARPYYAEALRLAEEQAATPATIDAVLTQAGGFRMGPFALMDLVGQDGRDDLRRGHYRRVIAADLHRVVRGGPGTGVKAPAGIATARPSP